MATWKCGRPAEAGADLSAAIPLVGCRPPFLVVSVSGGAGLVDRPVCVR